MTTYQVTVDDIGDIWWRLNDLLHREDGPAIECEDGDKFWYVKGLLHREDGPAIERASGEKSWLLSGKFHREDGPAVICANGDKYWYLHGKELTEAEHAERMKPAQELTVAEIEAKLGFKIKVVGDV